MNMTKKIKIYFGLILVLLVIEQSHGEMIKMLSKIKVKKSGVCPSVQSISQQTCVVNNTCTLDTDCSGSLKCCLIECSRSCVKPENATKQHSTETSGVIRNNLKFRKYSSRSDKVSSKCPKFNYTLSEADCKILNPKSDCETNYDCSLGKRCCFSECGARKCYKIESTKKLSNKKEAKNTKQPKQKAKQIFADPFYPYYSPYDFLSDSYYFDNYYYGFGGGVLQRRIPPTYGSRLNPLLGSPLALGVQISRPFSPNNRINQNTLRASVSSPSSRAQSRMPQFQLLP